MTFKEIQELIRLINKSNLTEFKMEKADFKIAIRTKKYGRGRAQIPAPQQIVSVPSTQVPVQMQPIPNTVPDLPQSAALSEMPIEKEAIDNTSHLVEIKSPIVGTFYRSSSPDKDPYIKVGDVIEKGMVVCIVEAMKLFNEIESEVSGRIVKVLLEDAQPVQYDQPLYLVDPAG